LATNYSIVRIRKRSFEIRIKPMMRVIIWIVFSTLVLLTSCDRAPATTIVDQPLSPSPNPTAEDSPENPVPTSTIALTRPPWQNVNAFSDPSQPINVKVGEEFSIGFYTAERLGYRWDESHDVAVLNLKEKAQVIYQYPDTPVTADATWFLYQATEIGQTQIVFKYYGIGIQAGYTKVVNIVIN
jgi:hypothetical protein